MFAAVHTVITVGLAYWTEAPYWDYIPIVPTAQRGAPHEVTTQLGEEDSNLDERTPPNPCETANSPERPTSTQEKILAVDNLPIALITGWHLPCSEPSRLDRQIQSWYGFTQEAESVTGRFISLSALLLWFVVGGFPMVRRRQRRWYTEPGLFMTLSTLLAMLLLGIGWSISRIPADSMPPISGYAAPTSEIVMQLAALPMLFVAAGWVWWVGLFFYTRAKATRRWLIRRGQQAD
jgi:hypothetical protein